MVKVHSNYKLFATYLDILHMQNAIRNTIIMEKKSKAILSL